MMENTELIKVLRCELYGDDECDKSDCPIWSELGCRNGIGNRAAAALEAAEKRIEELEAQMPKEGEWEWLSSTYDRVPREMRYWCSVCHHEEITHDDKPWKHYCPNCGARMIGEQ